MILMLIDSKWAVAVGVLIAGIFLLSTPVLAANGDTTNESSASNGDLFSALNQSVVMYNDNLSSVPQLILTIAGNDVILIAIEMDDGSELYIQAVTNNGEISEFSEVSSANDVDSTVEVTTDEATAWAITESDTPLTTLTDSVKEGDTDVEVSGFIKNAALRALIALYAAF
ncbi:MAG: hypothetical protein SCH66_06730 [Methanolobus sp.]|nr:hypothetical protein [Methanolobus sp.]